MTDIFARKPYSTSDRYTAEANFDENEGKAKEPLADVTPEDRKEPIDWEGRYGNLRATKSKKEASQADEITALKSQLAATQNQPLAPLRTDEEVDKFHEEHPNLAALVQTAAVNANADTRKEIDGLNLKLEEANNRTKKANALASLMTAHPDADVIIGTDAWHTWAEGKPESIQHMIYEVAPYDGMLISQYVAQFKAEQGVKENTDPRHIEQMQRAASRAVGNSSAGEPVAGEQLESFTNVQIDKMSMAEYEAKEEAIMKAQSAGLIT